MLTTFDTDRNILDAIRAGAAGFLLKDTGPEALREAVRVVAAGEALLSPGVARQVMQAAAASARPSPERLDVLTEREREILVEVGGTVERRDCHTAAHQPGHRADPRRAPAQQARRARPCTARGDRVRDRL